MKVGGRKYKFTPNRNTKIVFLILLLLLAWLVTSVASCARYNLVLKGEKYVSEAVLYPEFKVRECKTPDGTPTADYFEIYPPDENKKVIYLTFDDGPSKKDTPKVLDVLKKYNVDATFFVIGKNAEKNPEILKRMVREGHSVACHSYSHSYDVLYGSTEGFREEITKTREVVKNIIGENYADIIRFPGGAFREERAEFKEILIEENMPFVNWNCLTGDSETKNPVPANLLARAKKTASKAPENCLVMLMHDTGTKQATVDALPGIIEYFMDLDYEFCTLTRY